MSKILQCVLLFRSRVLILTTLAVFAFPAYGQSSTGESRVTLNLKNTPLKKVFSEITKQTKLYFLGNSDKLDQNERYTIKVENETVNKVLTQLLGDKGFIWTIKDNTVLIQKSNENIPRTEPSNAFSVDSLITVAGRVVNENGHPILGATVLIRGTKLGTTTASDGTFRISGVKPNAVVVITNVAFLSQEIALRGKSSTGDIVLKEYIGILDETVVIAYGETSTRLNPGNVVSIRAEEIERQPINNPLYALQGRVAGLQVTPTSGLQGSLVKVEIRGRNSLNQSSDPLYVIDGLPYTGSVPTLTPGVGVLGQGMSPLNFINPNDIASISILKDADATAIYGSRGANGVILITTKKGKPGVTKIEVNVQSGISEVVKRLKMMSTEQYLSMRKEALSNDGRIMRLNDPAYAGSYPDLMLWDQAKFTDWQKMLIGNTGKYTDIQTSISGGSEAVQYLLGGNYHKETTVFPGDNTDSKGGGHFSIRGNSQNRKFKTTLTGSYLTEKSNLTPEDFTNQALTRAPNAPTAYNSDGSINWALYPSTGANTTWDVYPYSATLTNQYHTTVNNLTTSADVEYRFGAITIKANAGYNELRGNSFKGSPLAGFPPIFSTLTSLRTANYSTNLVKNLSFEPQITYLTNVLGGKLQALIGSSFQSSTMETSNLNLYDFTSDALLKSQDAAAGLRSKGNTTAQYKYNALFSRISYNLYEKYLISLNARRDGSSRFGPGNQFGNFASIGAAWIFSEESIFKRTLPFISFGKLRFSYGTSGNDGIGNYQYLEQYQSTATNPYQGVIGYISSGLYNPDYHWETTRKLEFGLETGFLKDCIVLSTSFFINRSNNQLISYPIPTMAGYGSLTTNLPALIQNTGLEIVLHTNNIRSKQFNWTSDLNFTITRNKLIKYPDLDNSAYSKSVVGQPFYGYVDVYHSAGVDVNTGLYQFIDKDMKIVSNPTTSNFPRYGKDIRITTVPKFYGGLSNSFMYKKIYLDIFVQFVKQTGINPLYQFVFPGSGRKNQPAEIYGKQWQKVGDNAVIQQFSTTGKATIFDYYKNSDKGYTDASFVRVKNVSISYDLPMNDKRSIKRALIYLRGQNLFTVTQYQGLDPETQSLAFLPPLRTITVGVKIEL